MGREPPPSIEVDATEPICYMNALNWVYANGALRWAVSADFPFGSGDPDGGKCLDTSNDALHGQVAKVFVQALPYLTGRR